MLKLTIKNLPLEERPRERLVAFGAKSLSNSELLAIILRTGNKKENVLTLSKRILQEHQLNNLTRVRINTLKKRCGIGTAKACQLLASLELGKRLTSCNGKRKTKINSIKDIVKLIGPELKHLKKEHFVGIFLDTHNKVIAKENLFIGSLNATIIHPREIFQAAISESAAKIIAVHNHPSGIPRPSKEDIAITEQLISAGKILGIKLIEHIIIAGNSYCALIEEGYC